MWVIAVCKLLKGVLAMFLLNVFLRVEIEHNKENESNLKPALCTALNYRMQMYACQILAITQLLSSVSFPACDFIGLSRQPQSTQNEKNEHKPNEITKKNVGAWLGNIEQHCTLIADGESSEFASVCNLVSEEAFSSSSTKWWLMYLWRRNHCRIWPTGTELFTSRLSCYTIYIVISPIQPCTFVFQQ